MQVTLWGHILKVTNYKPGWWVLYFIYCAVPVVLYIWYLLKRVREVYFVISNVQIALISVILIPKYNNMMTRLLVIMYSRRSFTYSIKIVHIPQL